MIWNGNWIWFLDTQMGLVDVVFGNTCKRIANVVELLRMAFASDD
jgi:hypothetical protein